MPVRPGRLLDRLIASALKQSWQKQSEDQWKSDAEHPWRPWCLGERRWDSHAEGVVAKAQRRKEDRDEEER